MMYRGGSSAMHELIGRTITALQVSDGEEFLVFTTDSGVITYTTVAAYCCDSETWFADITGVSALLGHTVSASRVTELGAAADARTRREYDKLYGVTLTTDYGRCDIVFRNSSNGYYGGEIRLWEEDDLFGNPCSRDEIESVRNSLRPIVGDWSA